jgi:redox-sensitive bicupin YhaK (pirin superfamily)
MSWHACPQAECKTVTVPADPVELELVPQSRDLGGFEVRRALPAARRRTVGPFVFLDQMGPSSLGIGHGIDVRPHPHIGLATLTYLFRGEILHRDSLGSVQPIRPGEVNLMTAGRGIVHSERTPPALRGVDTELFGLQAWLALPARDEEIEPAFAHHGADELPLLEDTGCRVRLVAGALLGARSPVAMASDTLFADVALEPGGALPVAAEYEERALYLATGAVDIDGYRHEPGRLLVLKPGVALTVRAAASARFVVLGGAALDGPRHLWWNFVSTRKERIEAAKADWQAGRFPSVPAETEFIPLPAG